MSSFRSSLFQPGDLVQISTSDGAVLEVIAVNGESPYVRFDWNFPRCPIDDDESAYNMPRGHA